MSPSAILLDLSGPSRSKRLSCLELLVEEKHIHSNVINILLEVENVPPTITDYRERERHLETLLGTLNKDDSCSSQELHLLVIHHLLGSLYVNFEKFWGPTIRVIITILEQSKFRSHLLQVIVGNLKHTNDIIYQAIDVSDLASVEDRPDYVLHRNFIFQILTKFVYHIDHDSTLFMDEFFRFVQHELMVSPFIERYSRDSLSKSTQVSELEEADDVIAEPEESVREARRTNGKGKPKHSTKRTTLPEAVVQKRKSRETFITASKILQSSKNIAQLHRQSDLQSLILDLLCCRDSGIQKAAFNCLLAYDHDYLRPYVPRLLKIIDDKMVRTELTMFSVETGESHQILDLHREKLMKIVLRLLFGKMIGKIGRKSSGRDKADLRKTLVMRFIAGCTSDEILFFFSLLFDPIFTHIGIPYSNLEQELTGTLNYEKYVPLNKLQAMLGSLISYMEAVAHLKEESLEIVLKLINIISLFVVTPLEDKALIHTIARNKLESLKALKRECLNVISKFFEMFEYYQFKQDELDMVFKYLIWTSTPGFVDRNHATKTPFLRLISTFASNSVYHSLLVKSNKANHEEFLLQHVIDLYSDRKTTRPVLKFLASALASIIKPDRELTDADELESAEDKPARGPMIQDEDATAPRLDSTLYRTDVDVTFSQMILIPFIPVIFERLKRNCQDFVDKKDDDSRIENDELLLLSSLSMYLRDQNQSILATRLLLSSLSSQKKSDLILETIKSCQVLMRQVDRNTDPNIVALIANILGFQRSIDQRKELCNLVSILAHNDRPLTCTSEILQLMNSTYADLVDSPDLVKWSEGFQLAFQFLDSLDEASVNQIDVVRDSLILLLHQTGYIVNTIDRYEFSIRENCLVFYEKVAEKISMINVQQNSSFIRLIIDEILLDKFFKKGLRDTNDTIKHTFIGILRALAVKCHAKSKILNEFHLFCHENQDIDFWLNIRHIQLHNRSKALARLVADAKINEVSPKTLSSYFLPLAAGFLFSKAYKSVASLTENSIKLIGIICRRLSWKTYEATLSYYLGLLTKANATYQRTNIKLITEILKNFNFDLTGCEQAMELEDENAKLAKRMKKRIGASDDTNSSAIAADAPSGKKLSPSTARMVYFGVTKKLLPRMNSCFHEMTHVEFEHDKNMANYLPEKEEIKRIPMAYAIIQLLNLLPGRYVLFRDHLPSIFLKLASFLKSKNEDVRKAARLVLIKVMVFVGPAYLPDMLRVMKQNLDKGFHIHVLNFTIHSVLDKIALQYGDLDHSVHELVDSCMKEIFGKQSEDKEILQILAKTSEAKKTKSYDTLFILSSYISAEKLDYLMTSIKETLKTSSELKKVNKLSICIQKIFTGLSKNDEFPIERLLSFTQSTIEESIPSLKIRQTVEVVNRPNDQSRPGSKGPFREDRFLISKDFSRDRLRSKINEKGNLHMLVENCLRLLLLTFEKNRDKIRTKIALKRKLDSFIGLLSKCLKSSSPRCVMRSLKCLYFVARTKSDLPSFKTKSNSIMKKVFILLSLYNGVGMVQGDNLEMISMCFRTVTLLLLKCDHVKLTDQQARALLTYVEQDLYDTSRQSTAFGTLHSLLRRKIESPELADIMVKVSDLLVTSEDDKVRRLSIKLWQTYLLEYQHEAGTLQSHLTKFIRQLDYEFIDGRKSVLKVLEVVVSKFPEKLLRDYFDLLFHLLAQRVVNEESQEVRHQVAKLIGLLVQRLPEKQNYVFNRFLIPWSSDDKPELKLLGVKLISIFMDSCLALFSKDRNKVKKILEIVSDALEHNETCQLSSDENDESIEPEDDEVDENPDAEIQSITNKCPEVRLVAVKDKLNYHSLRLFKRLIDHEVVGVVEKRYIEILKKIWQSIGAQHLSNWYLPVILISCNLYSHFLKSTPIAESLHSPKPSSENYLDQNAKKIVRTLCDKYIELLDRADESADLLDYITEGLIIVGQILVNSKSTLEFEEKYLGSFEGKDVLQHLLELNSLPNDGFAHDHLPYKAIEGKRRLNLMWLSVKVINQARKEAALYRMAKYFRRNLVIKWTAAIVEALGPKRIAPYVILFTMVPARELTDKGKAKAIARGVQSPLSLAEDLLKFIKGLIGIELFGKVYSRVQLHYTRRRVERKKKGAVLRVKDQAQGVKRKMSQLRQKETSRKRTKIASRNLRKGQVARVV